MSFLKDILFKARVEISANIPIVARPAGRLEPLTVVHHMNFYRAAVDDAALTKHKACSKQNQKCFVRWVGCGELRDKTPTARALSVTYSAAVLHTRGRAFAREDP